MLPLEIFFKEQIRLPSPKAIAIRVLEALRKDEDTFAELATIIASDPALTARILKVANSAYYGFSEKVTTPSQAISVIGTKALKNIALSFVIFDSLPPIHQGSFDLDHFWRRAITCGVAAEMLAEMADNVSDDIFVCALLQDFGVLVLFLSLGSAYTEVFDTKRISGRSLQVEEHERFGYTHAEVAHRVLSSWQLPSSICEPILTHHEPPREEKAGPATILLLADRIGSIYHGNESSRRLLESRELLARHFGLNEGGATALIDRIGERARETIALFDIDTGNMQPISQIMQEANDELARLNYSYEQLVMELTQAKRSAEQMAVELKKANDSLRDLALRDGLTGLYNHRYFQDFLATSLESATRYNHPLSLLLLDIDNFKKVNDMHGHPAGDIVLRELGELLVKLARKCDVVARYGGEEFAVILPETGTSGARVLANRLRRGVEQHRIHHGTTHIPITISIGCTTTGEDGRICSRSALIARSDCALYTAKRCGRNRVETAEQEEQAASM